MTESSIGIGFRLRHNPCEEGRALAGVRPGARTQQITAATLIGGFSWLGWFALMSVPYYALLAGGAAALRLLVGRFDRADALKLGLAMLTPTIAVALLTLPYWALLGFPLRAA